MLQHFHHILRHVDLHIRIVVFYCGLVSADVLKGMKDHRIQIVPSFILLLTYMPEEFTHDCFVNSRKIDRAIIIHTIGMFASNPLLEVLHF